MCKPRREAWNKSFPHSPWKETTLTPWVWTSSLQNCKTSFSLVFQSTYSAVLSYSSLRKLTQIDTGKILTKNRRMRKALHVSETAQIKRANQNARYNLRKLVYLKQNVHVEQWQNIPGRVRRLGLCTLGCVLHSGVWNVSQGRGEPEWHFIRSHVIIKMLYQEDGEQDELEKEIWKKVAQLQELFLNQSANQNEVL